MCFKYKPHLCSRPFSLTTQNSRGNQCGAAVFHSCQIHQVHHTRETVIQIDKSTFLSECLLR